MEHANNNSTLPGRNSSGPEMRDNAIHEAGHAVIAIRLGLGLGREVRLIQEGIGHRAVGCYEEVAYGHTTSGRRGSKEEDGVFLLAGMEAEQHFNRNAHERPHWDGDRMDFWRLFPEDSPEFTEKWDACQSKAKELVLENASAIEAVAAALLENEEHVLSPNEVVALVDKFGGVMTQPKDPRAKTQIDTLNPVAIKAGQTEVNAPGHETWGSVTCDQCGEKFFVGPNRLYPDDTRQMDYVKRFEGVLADDHKRGDKHQNSYDLGW